MHAFVYLIFHAYYDLGLHLILVTHVNGNARQRKI